jgi:hypothetical protein
MKTKYYCKCGREISYNSVHYGKGRCVWCANKGENNPNSKGLITLKKYFCIECNTPIHYQAYLYGKQM